MNNTILVIEDNLLNLKNLHTILVLSNYKVLTAENGISGVEKAKSEKPDLIICDIMMPELDGYSVLHMLGKDPQTSSIPFIFLSSKAKKSDFRQGMNQGADDYITKPFEDLDLLNTIEKRLSKSRKSMRIPELIGSVNDSKALSALIKLSENKKTRVLKKRDHLFLSGDFPNGIFYLLKGKVKASIMNFDGKEFITGLYKEGDFIGFPSVLNEMEYGYSTTALEDAEVVKIPKDEFLALYNNNVEVVKIFNKILSDNICDRENRLLSMAYSSVRKRIADTLLQLYVKYKKADEKMFVISVMRQDLANMVGTSKETVTRTLSEFKDEGILDIQGSEITFCDYDRLQKIRW
ncbi:MAG: response regulator [Bacteroidetes bacterium]|nr:response regulator [Bacteroidota bacterium]